MTLSPTTQGENQEYCKQTLFEDALRTPLLVSVPWLPSSFGRASQSLVELIDVFPTLQSLAGFEVSAFLEGVSHAHEIQGSPPPAHKRGGNRSRFAQGRGGNRSRFALAQFPRCVPAGANASLDWRRNSCNRNTSNQFTAMGMSLRTSDGWRYTRWVRWMARELAPDWTRDFGEELYDLRTDSADGDLDAQSDNVAAKPENAALVATLRAAMQKAFSRK